MARVRFLSDFDYKPTSQSTIAYRAGTEMTVKRECADQAIAAKKAIEVERKSEESDDGEDPAGQ